LSKYWRTISNSTESTDEKKPPCGGFFSQEINYFLAGSTAAGAAAAAAGAASAAAGAAGAAGAAAAAAGASTAGAATGAATSSFLPQAAKAAAAITAAKTRDLFIFENTKVSLRNNFRKLSKQRTAKT
jgi:hypothetical protein